MNEVFEKTRELGEALLRSEEYLAMKAAEEKALSNEEASKVVGRFLELRGQMETLMSDNEKDWAKVQAVTDEIEECKKKMGEIDDLIALDKARDDFGALINNINSVLHFIVSGTMENDEEGGCTGSCETCGGCSGKVN